MFKLHHLLMAAILAFNVSLVNAATSPVSIDESFNAATSTGYYNLTNNSTEAIWFFAVSHTAASNAQTTRNYGNTSPLSLFGAETISKADWNAGFDYNNIGQDYDFDTYFGSDTLLNTYFELDGFGISSGETTGNQFSYTALGVASNWIALGVNGGVFSGVANVVGGPTIPPSAVPVPAAALLFAPALLGFLGFRRKLQA